MVSIMEVPLEEGSPELRLKEAWPSPDLGLLPYKVGMKPDGWGSSPSLLEPQWQDFPSGSLGPFPSWVFSERTPLPQWTNTCRKGSLSSI